MRGMLLVMFRAFIHAAVMALIACTAFAQSETIPWGAGVAYTYDGSGNIASIGTDAYKYDAAGRVISATTYGVTRTFEYDAQGNRTQCSEAFTGNCQNGITYDSSTNRINQATYDAAGNVTAINGHSYTYDALNMQITDSGGPYVREYLYTADDERIGVHNTGAGWRWSVRDTSGKVLSEFTSNDTATGNWQWSKDYVYRDGLILASRQVEPGASAATTYHHHLDHLGTPRRITNDAGLIVGVHDYHAFGPELSNSPATESAPSAIKYTGHERDLTGHESIATLDYMHARYYSPYGGRFLSVDPGKDWDPGQPQRWNLYTYARNNPLRFTDPDGRAVTPETLWDGANVVMGAISFVGNVRHGNYGAAAVDAIGVVVDSAATVVPLLPGGAGTLINFVRGADKIEDAVDASQNARRSTDFVVTPNGEAIPIPNGAVGPTAPQRGSGMSYQNGSGGKGMDKRTTGVRIMDANNNQGARVNYMNQNGQTVNPATGRTIPNSDPAGHKPLKPPPDGTTAPCPSEPGCQ